MRRPPAVAGEGRRRGVGVSVVFEKGRLLGPGGSATGVWGQSRNLEGEVGGEASKPELPKLGKGISNRGRQWPGRSCRAEVAREGPRGQGAVRRLCAPAPGPGEGKSWGPYRGRRT